MIIKRTFLPILCSLLFSTTISTKEYDEAALAELVRETADVFMQITENFENTRHMYGNKIEKYMKALISSKKIAIKTIQKRLKKEYKDLKDKDHATFISKRDLYRAFKNQVYRTWKSSGDLPVF